MTKADMIEVIFNRAERLLERAELKEKCFGNNSPEHNEARDEFGDAMSLIFALELEDDYTTWQVKQMTKAENA